MSADKSVPLEVTATGVVWGGSCYVTGFSCLAGTNPAITLRQFDASGARLQVPPASGHTIGVTYPLPYRGVFCPDGVHATIGGTSSPAYTVFVDPE